MTSKSIINSIADVDPTTLLWSEKLAMITVSKKGISEEQSREVSKQVREVVEGILQGISDHGDTHVRELSEKFDNWSPTSSRLSDEGIQACIYRQRFGSLTSNTAGNYTQARYQIFSAIYSISTSPTSAVFLILPPAKKNNIPS